MTSTEPHVEVEITFLRPEEGGRTTPVRFPYRPPFYYDGAMWDAFYTYPTDDWIYPGETVTALVTFLSPDAHRGHLHEGKSFELREGSHVVARGHVTKLIHLG